MKSEDGAETTEAPADSSPCCISMIETCILPPVSILAHIRWVFLKYLDLPCPQHAALLRNHPLPALQQPWLLRCLSKLVQLKASTSRPPIPTSLVKKAFFLLEWDLDSSLRQESRFVYAVMYLTKALLSMTPEQLGLEFCRLASYYADILASIPALSCIECAIPCLFSLSKITAERSRVWQETVCHVVSAFGLFNGIMIKIYVMLMAVDAPIQQETLSVLQDIPAFTSTQRLLRHSENAATLNNDGVNYLKQGQFMTAAANFVTSIKWLGDSRQLEVVLNNVGCLLIKLRKIRLAVQVFYKAHKLFYRHSTVPSVSNNFAVAMLESGKSHLAEMCLEQSLRDNPSLQKLPEAWLNLALASSLNSGTLMLSAGYMDRATRCAERIADSTYKKELLGLITLYQLATIPERDSFEELQKAQELTGTNSLVDAVLANNSAIAHLNRGDLWKASREWTRAIQLTCGKLARAIIVNNCGVAWNINFFEEIRLSQTAFPRYSAVVQLNAAVYLIKTFANLEQLQLITLPTIERQADPETYSCLLNAQGAIHFYRGDLAKAYQSFSESLDGLPRRGHPYVIVRTNQVICMSSLDFSQEMQFAECATLLDQLVVYPHPTCESIVLDTLNGLNPPPSMARCLHKRRLQLIQQELESNEFEFDRSLEKFDCL